MVGAVELRVILAGTTLTEVAASSSRAVAALLVAMSYFPNPAEWQSGRVGHIVQCWALALYDLLWGIVHDCRVLNQACQQFWELYNDLVIHSFLLTPNFWFL